jgi:TM2 domain-containing membrane protein YozV
MCLQKREGKSMNYIIKSGDEEQGPYSFDDLEMYEQIGDVTSKTPVRLENRDVWTPWYKIKEEYAREKNRLEKYQKYFGSPSAPVQKSIKQRGVFIILGLLLGGIGAHNFYANYYGRAICQLLLTLVCVAIFPLGLLAIAGWIVVELIVTDKDAEGFKLA